jgi:hypothetical protein
MRHLSEFCPLTRISDILTAGFGRRFFYTLAFEGAIPVDGQIIGNNLSLKCSASQNFYILTICSSFKQSGDCQSVGREIALDFSGLTDGYRTLGIDDTLVLAINM